jgi:hypothetical protein
MRDRGPDAALLEVQRLAIELAGRVLLDAGIPAETARARLVALHAQDVESGAGEPTRAHARACVAVARSCLDVDRSVRALATRVRTLHGPGVRASTLAYVALVARGALPEGEVRHALIEAARTLGLEDADVDRVLARDDAAMVDPDVAAALERLDVGTDVSEDALRRAYRAAARAHHPDRHAQGGADAAEAAREEMARVNAAHERLVAWIAAGRPRRTARPADRPPQQTAPWAPAPTPGGLRPWHVAVLAALVLGGGWLATKAQDAPPDAIIARFSGPGRVEVRCGARTARGDAAQLRLPAATTCGVRDPEVPERHAEVLVDRDGHWRCFGRTPGCTRDGAR